ncbi:hypothetical protein I3760_11G063600 [Carya illinoinensis]|nr:hypothetical protein I3760_11G063600 [Carya illinoinensis]
MNSEGSSSNEGERAGLYPMIPKFVSWNVHGLNKANKRLQVRKLLWEWKADIICLQETKLKRIDRKIVRSIWSCVHMDWVFMASNGASGGVLVMWDRRVVEKMKEFIGLYLVACFFKSVTDNFLWAFVGVDGPNLDNNKRYLWKELAGVHSWWDLPWCIGGDFNVIRFPSDLMS